MINLTFHFVCDRCGKEEQGRSLTAPWGKLPSSHSSLPLGWYRTYGYDLCAVCAQERRVRERVNNLFNSTLHAMKGKTDIDHHEGWELMWKECRLPTYVDIHEYVNQLRNKEAK